MGFGKMSKSISESVFRELPINFGVRTNMKTHKRLSRIVALSTILVVSGLSCVAVQMTRAQQRSSVRTTQRRPVEIENFISNARTAPPEAAADLLIRLAESDRITDRAWKRELLEEAFRFAANAQQPIKRVSLPGSDRDSRAGYLSTAFNHNLDSLSLRNRAVTAMLTVDRQLARQLFSEISPRLPLQALNCEDALVYDVSDFYETLTRIAQTTFSPEEIQRGDDIYFVTPYVENMTSSAQVAPIASTILALRTSPNGVSMLVHAFGAALSRISGDDRSFTYSLMRDSELINSVIRMAAQYDREGAPPVDLLRACRIYLVNNLRANRCADNVTIGGQNSIDYVNAINGMLYRDNPISADEIRPARVEGTPRVNLYWQTSESQRLLSTIRELRFSSEGRQLTDAEKQSPRWQQNLIQFQTQLADWSGRGEDTRSDYLHQKSVLYQGLIEIVPAGAARNDVIRGYIRFLTEPEMQQVSQMEWFSHANYLIERARTSQGTERTRFLGMLENSNNPSLQLYAYLIKNLTQSSEE